MLTGPRVLFAVRETTVFALLPNDPRFGTPALAIGAVAIWSCVLIWPAA
jgi:hypothetical protein